ncbi:hypothetical protein [Lapidilactobacillus bayanensis]|uniref:hypothetical protein n=1 Tax=Lapidilactobacillus bayanensis TaxID=2485998 RepID=UPI001CDCB3FB|nr:hypothetical protein [Lapidilactobacillus bayanensis]
MTDWWNQADQVQEIIAGNNLKMPDGDPKRVLDACKENKIDRNDLIRNVRYVLKTILKGE